ncbi:MAG: metallophosphoesterase [Clostridia bacterium]|nr:metallophosphoesterase [Clostridia bacterium]
MKILHCADIHLGSKMESKFPKEKSDERKRELRAAMSRMVEYAKRNDINVIILAGDIFDSDRPLKKDKEFFYSVVRNTPEIDFLYLRGNHDTLESYTEYGLENLKTFSDIWTSYDYGDAVITGLEITDNNALSMYSSLSLEKGRNNIVVLHGQTGNSSGVCKIRLSKLRNKNVDYLALGHIHTFSSGKIDERGQYAYSGCLEGRGFDEFGQKGFVEIIADEKITFNFVPNCSRVFEEITVDLSDTEDLFTACQKVQSFIKCKPSDIVRVNLSGEVAFDTEGLDKEIEKQLEHKYYFISVKNATYVKYDAASVEGDVSLRGEFIRAVLQSDYSEEDKNAIISCGLKALRGGEVE